MCLYFTSVDREPNYDATGFKKGYHHEAEPCCKDVISIPMFPTISATQEENSGSCISELFRT